MARAVTVLSFAVLLALFEFGSCLRCRQCSSPSDPACADPFKSTKPAVDCASPETGRYNVEYLNHYLPAPAGISVPSASVAKYCHKIITATGTVIRSCLDANSFNMNATCMELDRIGQTIPSKRITYCSVCNTDDCNGASAAAASLPLALTLLVSYLYFK